MWPKNDNTLQRFFAGAILSALSVGVSDFLTRLRCLARIWIKSTVCRVWYEHTNPTFFWCLARIWIKSTVCRVWYNWKQQATPLRIQVRAVKIASTIMCARIQVRVLPLVAKVIQFRLCRYSNQCAFKKRRPKRNIVRKREMLFYVGINIE